MTSPLSLRIDRPAQSRVRQVGGVMCVLVALVIAAGCGFFPGKFDMSGSFALPRSGAGSDGAGGCKGIRGFVDIVPGKTVSVYDQTGAGIGNGALGEGMYSGSECEFPFTVADVPGGKSSYTLEVGARGKVTYSEAQAKSGSIALQLG